MNIRKMLDDQLKDVLPDKDTNKKIKSNIIKDLPKVEKEEKKTYSFGWKKFGFSFLTACICIAICLTIVHFAFIPVESEVSNSYISIDINPSFIIETDLKDNVISVKARNKDAAIVLYGLRLENKSLNEVCNLLIETSVKLGYLSNDNDVTILAVNDNAKKENQISTSIVKNLNSFLDTLNLDSIVVDARTSYTEEDARKNKTTIGKLALVNKAEGMKILNAIDMDLLELNNKIDSLNNKEVEEVNKLLEEQFEAIEDNLEIQLDELEKLIELSENYIDKAEEIIEEASDMEIEAAIEYYNAEIAKLVAPNDTIMLNRYKGLSNEELFVDFIESELERAKVIYEDEKDEFERLEDEYELKLDSIKNMIKEERDD